MTMTPGSRGERLQEAYAVVSFINPLMASGLSGLAVSRRLHTWEEEMLPMASLK